MSEGGASNESLEQADQEARWVEQALNGDQNAFDRLVATFQRRAVAVAYRLLGNSHDAADVAQEAFFRAYRNLSSLDDPRRFGPWLMRIVTNQALNFRRSRGRSSAMAMDDVVEGTETLRSPSGEAIGDQNAMGDPEEATELKQKLNAAIEQLPEKQRLALVLFTLEGLPQKEIAEIMECSIELVKWNVFQARKKLRKLMGDVLEQ